MNPEPSHPFSLRGQRALITGGGTGLGLAMTSCFIEAGAQVVSASRHRDAALDEFGDAVVHYDFDVTDTDGAPGLISRVIDEQGPIDVLVNNAGNQCRKPIEEMSVDDFRSVVDVHLVGAFALTKALVPHLRERGGGSILFIASMASYLGLPFITGYAAGKAGHLGVMRSLAAELGPDGIRVNAIAPGWIDTAIFRQVNDEDPERKRKILSRTPLGRFGETRDIGLAAVYLSSPAAAFVTGSCLPVDGGALIGL